MADDLKKTQLRATQYEFVDGTFEFGFGLLFLLLAAFFFAETHAQGWLLAFVDSFLVLVMIGGAWLANRVMKRIKEAVTWPRTGYIAYRHEPRPLKHSARLIIRVGVPLVTAILLVLLFLNRSYFQAQPNHNYDLYVFPFFSGLLFSGLYAIIAWKIALPRFYLTAVATFIIGAGLLVSGLPTYSGMALFFGAMSLTLFLSGGVTLWTYLRSTRAPEDTPPAE